jgi:hypothetical protein
MWHGYRRSRISSKAEHRVNGKIFYPIKRYWADKLNRSWNKIGSGRALRGSAYFFASDIQLATGQSPGVGIELKETSATCQDALNKPVPCRAYNLDHIDRSSLGSYNKSYRIPDFQPLVFLRDPSAPVLSWRCRHRVFVGWSLPSMPFELGE